MEWQGGERQEEVSRRWRSPTFVMASQPLRAGLSSGAPPALGVGETQLWRGANTIAG